MSLLHLSIPARAPETVARAVARIIGGEAQPFPPYPDCWIAFSAADDGTAVEVWPDSHRITKGSSAIQCETGQPSQGPGVVHVALASPLYRDALLALAAEHGWTARQCNRGPFDCIEIWIEERLLIEALDPEMTRDYRAGMTVSGWREMFGL